MAYLLGALELNHNDGPWVRPDDYQKVNGVLRYSRGDNRNGFSVTGMGYWADWDSTDQVPDRAIDERPHLAFRPARSPRTAARPAVRASPRSSSDRVDPRRFARPASSCTTASICFRTSPTSSTTRRTAISSSRRSGASAAGGRVTYRRLGHFFERHAESAVGVQMRQRLARSRRPLSHGRAAAAVDHPRGPGRPDHDRRVRAERDRMDADAAHDVRPARRRVSASP